MADIVIDSSKCQGHGRCALIAPEIFGVDDTGFAFLRIETIPVELRASAEEAIITCPESAISFEG